MKPLYGHTTDYPYRVDRDGYGSIADDESVNSLENERYQWAYSVGLLSPYPQVVADTLSRIIDYAQRLPGHDPEGAYFFRLRWSTMMQWNRVDHVLHAEFQGGAKGSPFRYSTRGAALTAMVAIHRNLISAGSVDRVLDMLSKEET